MAGSSINSFAEMQAQLTLPVSIYVTLCLCKPKRMGSEEWRTKSVSVEGLEDVFLSKFDGTFKTKYLNNV